MTTVPVPVAERSVRQSDQTQPYYGVRGDPDAFGAPVGQALAQAGRAITHGTSEIGEAIQRKEEEERALRIQEKLIGYQRATNDLLYKDDIDPTTGQPTRKAFLSLKGEEAVNARPALDQSLQQLRSKLLSGVTDPKEQRVLAMRSQQNDMHVVQQGDVHTFREREQWKKSVIDAKTSAISDAIYNGNWRDNNWLEGQLKEQDIFIAANFGSQGKEAVAQMQKDQRSKVYYNLVATVAQTDPMAAADMAESWKREGKFAAEQVLKLEPVLAAKVRARQVQTTADQILQAGTTANNAAQALVPTDQQAGQPIPDPGPKPEPRPEAQRAGSSLPGSTPLTQAVGVVESSGGQNVVGPDVTIGGKTTRAYGIWQMLPDTARFLSQRNKDGFINPKMTDQEIGHLLIENPTLAEYYATQYLADGIEKYGSLTASIIRYFAGDGAVDKWVAANKDMSVLGPKTRDYVAKVMDRYADLSGEPGHPKPIADPTERVMGSFRGTLRPDHSSRLTRENWNQSTIGFYKPQDLLPPTGGYVDERSAQMLDRLAVMFTSQHKGKIPRVNDDHDFDPSKGTAGRRRGYSDPKDNPHVSKSQHLQGRAFDVQIQGFSPEEKADYLRMALEMGFTGIGFYGDSGHLHLDTGRARVWGDMPKWAREVMQNRPPVRGQESFAFDPNNVNVPFTFRRAYDNPNASLYESFQRADPTGFMTIIPLDLSSPRAWTDPPSVAVPAPSPTEPPVQTSVRPATEPTGASQDDPMLRGVSALPVAVAHGPTSRDAPIAALAQVPGYVPLGDFNPNEIRQRFEEQTKDMDPVIREQVRARVEAGISQKQSVQNENIKRVKQEAFRQVFSGQARRNDLPPDMQALIWNADPQFWKSLEDVENRNQKQSLTPDALKVWANGIRLAATDPMAFANLDLSKYITLLPPAQFEELVRKQATIMENAQDLTKLGPPVSAAITAREKSLGLNEEQAAMLTVRMDQVREDHKRNTGKEMTLTEANKALDELTQTVTAKGDGPLDKLPGLGVTKYLFEFGSPSDNQDRRVNNLPLPQEVYPNLEAPSYDAMPGDARIAISSNLRNPRVGPLFGVAPGGLPSKDRVQLIYNDGLKARAGLKVVPPEDLRLRYNQAYRDGMRRRYYPDDPNGPEANAMVAGLPLLSDENLEKLYRHDLMQYFPMAIDGR